MEQTNTDRDDEVVAVGASFFLRTDCGRSLVCASLFLLALPLTFATAYHVAGANPRDEFRLNLETPTLDLDSGRPPWVRFSFTNLSKRSVFLRRLDADYGCRIEINPGRPNIAIAPGQTRIVECELEVDRAFLLPRTQSRHALSVEVRPLIRDDRGNGYALPIYSFKQVFHGRVTANTDRVRLAIHPELSDSIGDERSVILRPVGLANIGSIRAVPADTDSSFSLSVASLRRVDGTVLVTVYLHAIGAFESDDPIEAQLVIETVLPDEGSPIEVQIPIEIRRRWTA